MMSSPPSDPFDNDDNVTDTIVGLMDFTLLDHEANENDLHYFCDKANIAKPAAVCVFSEHISIVKHFLDENIRLAAVCGGFPVGSTDSHEVIKDIETAMKDGADEVDIVLEPSKDMVTQEHRERFLVDIRKSCSRIVLKVIVETPLLTEEEIRQACHLALATGSDFIKSCTGKRGVCTLEAAGVMAASLRSFEEASGDKRGIKLSGGVQTKLQAMDLISAIIAQHPSILCEGRISRHDSRRIRLGASSLLRHLIPQLYDEKHVQNY